MTKSTRYDPHTAEPALADAWARSRIYDFDPHRAGVVYAIDTPPPSVSGHLHLGNVYSYSHTDFIARYRRMRGENVFYPMGFDDNGLPSERLVERELGITPSEVGRQEFIDACLRTTRTLAAEYRDVWQRLGLSVDWSYTYHTIGARARRTAQSAFLHLLRDGRAYRREAPVIWCPECQTAIAQAEVDDVDRETLFVTVRFETGDGRTLPIATTRPELLPACVAVFVHPGDERYREFVGRKVAVPLTGQSVPVYADDKAVPTKGTGAVMCCTFGDATDIEWWYQYNLPLRPGITATGNLSPEAGTLANLTVGEARGRVVEEVRTAGALLGIQPVAQTIRVHERCGTPTEYVVTPQWFIRVLDRKQDLLGAGDSVQWVPSNMRARYRDWIQNLSWDWLISRQRVYGVPFPVWFCVCGQVLTADESHLPVDPVVDAPSQVCTCGSTEFTPERDVMDTWATSSLTPQIVGRELDDPALFERVFPMSLRPQAHEIIRTWAFYTIVQSLYGSGSLPWKTIMISGWGLAPQGMGKISKSKGGGPMAPKEMLEQYSADAVRYWAASTGPGKDAFFSREKVEAGTKLSTKIWNVGTFSRRFLETYVPPTTVPTLSAADRWILSSASRLIDRCTDAMDRYDYAAAKNDIEMFFWGDLADNYLEMAKSRLYSAEEASHNAAQYALYYALLTSLKLFAPFLPFVTDAVYGAVFADTGSSIHVSSWPQATPEWRSEEADELGSTLLEIAGRIRRYKSDFGLSLAAPLNHLQIGVAPYLVDPLRRSISDIRSVTRADTIALFPAQPDSPAVTIAVRQE